MEKSKALLVQRYFVIWILVICTAASIDSAYGQTERIVLWIKQTPLQGGTTTPPAGIHYFDPNTMVILTAKPKSGYRFVYWLGDVSDPTASTTITYLDAPKIIIAVFEYFNYEFSAPSAGSALGGAEDLTATPLVYPVPHLRPFIIEEYGPFPIPEPATFLLLACAAVMLRKKR